MRRPLISHHHLAGENAVFAAEDRFFAVQVEDEPRLFRRAVEHQHLVRTRQGDHLGRAGPAQKRDAGGLAVPGIAHGACRVFSDDGPHRELTRSRFDDAYGRGARLTDYLGEQASIGRETDGATVGRGKYVRE